MSDHADVWYAYVDLTHRYAEAVDLGAGSRVAELFVADGRWDGSDFRLDVLVGRDALTRHFAGGGDDAASVHLVHNHLVVEATGSTAVASSYAHVIMPREDRVRHLIVRYDDVVTCNDEWRFVERVLRRVLSY